MAKSRCGTCGHWFEDDELDEHLNTHMDEHDQPPLERVPLKCPYCNIDTDAYYDVPFRVGGTGPVGRLLIGALGEFGEEPIPINIFVCPQCGRIQQSASEKTKTRLRRATKEHSQTNTR